VRAPEKDWPGQCERTETRPDTADADNVETKHNTTVIVLPRADWKTAMCRAYAIRKYQGRAKDHAVHLWRVAVTDALGQEVRQ
jgi:hypothetical protein